MSIKFICTETFILQLNGFLSTQCQHGYILLSLCRPWNLRHATKSYTQYRSSSVMMRKSTLNIPLESPIVTQAYEHEDALLTNLMRDIFSRGSDEKSCHSYSTVCPFNTDLHNTGLTYLRKLLQTSHTHNFLHTR